MCVALVLSFKGSQFALASPIGEHIHGTVTSGLSGLASMIWSLKDTPEPGSLFLLGGVLFSLALFISWKSSRSAKQYGDAAMVQVERQKSDSH